MKPAKAILGKSLFVLALSWASAAIAQIETRKLADDVYLFQGAGSNVVAIASNKELLVIDGGSAEHSRDLLKAIKEATGTNTINTLILTHWHPDQVGLNEKAGKDGATIIAHEQTALYLSNSVTSPLLGSIDQTPVSPLPVKSRPTLTVVDRGSLEFAGHHIDYGYLPAAHTNGDLYIHIPGLNLLLAGDAVGSDSWPLIDYWNGAFIGGLVRAQETLSDLTTPDTIVIPAHGRPESAAELAEQRNMYQNLFVEFSALMNAGMGYDDVVEQNPLHGFEERYGDPSAFLDGAFRSKEMAYVPN